MSGPYSPPPGMPPGPPPPGTPAGPPPPPGGYWPPAGYQPPPPGPTYALSGPSYAPSGPLPGPPPGTRPGGYVAAHKPGAVPLRPLRLGDILDAAFKIIRYNPKATVGSSVLVAALAMAIPVLVTAVVAFAVDVSVDPEGNQIGQEAALAWAGVLGSFVLGSVLQSLGLILVTGMVAQVTMAATLGARMGLSEAWAATAGRRWRLVGLTLLLGLVLTVVLVAYLVSWVAVISADDWGLVMLWGVLTVPLVVAGLCWFWIRVYYLPVPVLMLEDVGIWRAVTRAYDLTRGHFWRLFGIALLTSILTGVASSMLSMPIAMLGQVPLLAGAGTQTAFVILMLSQALSTVVGSAFTAPFSAAVTSLLYLDQRMRKEAFDVELIARTGLR